MGFYGELVVSRVRVSHLPIALLNGSDRARSLYQMATFTINQGVRRDQSMGRCGSIHVLFSYSTFTRIHRFQAASKAILQFTIRLTRRRSKSVRLLYRRLHFTNNLYRLLFPIPISLLNTRITGLRMISSGRIALLTTFRRPYTQASIVRTSKEAIIRMSERLYRSQNNNTYLHCLLKVKGPITPPMQISITNNR